MINIASTTDSDFADVLMTSYVSILENNLDSNFQFFIIDDKLTVDDKRYILQLQNIYENVKKINFINVNTSYYKKANINRPSNAIKENTYYRLELPLIVDVSRLLYLDCDMICKGSIANLWNADLHGNIIGAVEDQGYPEVQSRYSEMHVKHQNNRYFNGGLILFDIKKWNQADITQKVRQFIKTHPNILRWQDQDALNVVLNGKWQMLDPKYNVISHLAMKDYHNPDPVRDRLDQKAYLNPVMIHYSSWSKPWVRTGKWVHPWRDQYFWYKYIATMRLHDYAVNKKTAKKENPIK